MKKFSAAVLVAAALAVFGAAAPAAAADATAGGTTIPSKSIDGGTIGLNVGIWPH